MNTLVHLVHYIALQNINRFLYINGYLKLIRMLETTTTRTITMIITIMSRKKYKPIFMDDIIIK